MTSHKFPGVGATVRFLFTTNAATGAAVAPLSALEAADVILYKDGSATQRTSTSGWTMTSPFDSTTGLHQIAMDLSDNTDAGFYAVGSEYELVLAPDETVDGVAVVGVIGSFRIVAAESVAGVPKVDVSHISGSAVSTTTAQLGVNVVQLSTDATAADNAEAFFDGTGYAGTNNVIPLVTTTTTATNVTTVNGLAANVITATSINDDAITAAKIADGAIDSATLATGTITAEKFAAGAVDAAALAADAGTEIAAAVWDMDATAHQTQGTFGQAIGDPVADTNTIFKAVVTDATGATVGVDVVAMKVDTAAILVDTGTTLDGRIPAALTAGGNMKSDALAIDGSTEAADRLQQSAEKIATGTVGAASTTTSVVTSALSPSAAVADQFKGRIIVFDRATTTTNLRGQATDITASSNVGVLTCSALTTAPVSGDTFVIL